MADKKLSQTPLFSQYGISSKGNFRIIDKVPTTHYYMITPKHLQYNNGMILGQEQIEQMEKQHGSLCGYNCGKLYNEYKFALLVECKIDIKGKNDKINSELHKFLLKNKDLATKEDYEGFAFKKADQ